MSDDPALDALNKLVDQVKAQSFESGRAAQAAVHDLQRSSEAARRADGRQFVSFLLDVGGNMDEAFKYCELAKESAACEKAVEQLSESILNGAGDGMTKVFRSAMVLGTEEGSNVYAGLRRVH